MKEKKKLLQKHEFCTKGKVHIMNENLKKTQYYGFLGVKGDLFQRRKLVERSFLSIY